RTVDRDAGVRVLLDRAAPPGGSAAAPNPARAFHAAILLAAIEGCPHSAVGNQRPIFLADSAARAARGGCGRGGCARSISFRENPVPAGARAIFVASVDTPSRGPGIQRLDALPPDRQAESPHGAARLARELAHANHRSTASLRHAACLRDRGLASR